MKSFSATTPVKGERTNGNSHRGYFLLKSKNILLTLLISLLLVSSGAMAQGQSETTPKKLWSLRDCINYALKNNITVKQSYLTVKSSKADLLQSKLNFLPSFNASTDGSSSWGRTYVRTTNTITTHQTKGLNASVSGNITLFNGFQNLNNLRMQEFNYLAAKYNSDEIKDNVSLNIAAAYLQILYNIESVKNAKRQLESTQDQINLTKKEVEVGKVARGSLLDIEAQGASDKVSLVKAQNQLMLSYLDLMQLLELKSNTPFDIQKPELQITHRPNLLPIISIYNTAVGIMPQIKNAEYNVKAAGASLAISRGQRSPSLSLSSFYSDSYSTSYTDPQTLERIPFADQIRQNPSYGIQLNLSIPIFNHFQVSTAIAKSKISLQQAKLTLENQKNTLRKNIETAYTDAIASYQTYEASLKSVESLKEAFKYAKEKFNVGLMSSTDYTLAKNNYYNAESTLNSAKYDYIFKTKILDFYLGRTLSLKDIAAPASSTK